MSDVLNNDDMNALAAEYVLGTLDFEERKGASSLLEADHAFRGLIRIWERRFGELHLMVEPVEPDAKVWERIKGKLSDQLTPAAAALENIPPAEAPATAEDTAGEQKTTATPDAAGPEPVTQAPSISPAVETPAVDPTTKLLQELEEASRLIAPATTETTAPPAEPPRQPVDDKAAVSDEAKVTPRPLRRWRLLAVMMSLVALTLAGLIGAWRFAPDMLPEQLRATSLLQLSEPEPPPLPPPRKPLPPDFDE
jgi:hypothetical protein